MIEALNRGMEAGAWAFGALLIFGLGVLLVALGVAGLGWAFGDEGKGEREKGKGIAGDPEGMEPRDEEGEPVDDLIRQRQGADTFPKGEGFRKHGSSLF